MSNKAENLAAAVQSLIANNWEDAFISLSTYADDKVNIHVQPAYFDEHFAGRDIVEEEWPAQKKVRETVELECGSKIFCLKDAVFERVA
jgi:hypothetical protein